MDSMRVSLVEGEGWRDLVVGYLKDGNFVG